MTAQAKLLLFLFGVCILSVLLLGTTSSTELATNQKMIQGSWYCPSDVRFDFNPDGTFMWLSYIFIAPNLRGWSPDFISPLHYMFSSPVNIHIDKNNEILIESLAPESLDFKWSAYGQATSYKCTRTRPHGDTDTSRAASAAALDKQKLLFRGRWVTRQETEYVEFLADDVCVRGILKDGVWGTSRDKYRVSNEGKEISCGGAGIFLHEAPDKIVLSYGMGGEDVAYYRLVGGQIDSQLKNNFPPDPAAKTISLATRKGVVIVRNFYSGAAEITPDKISVLIERKPSYDITFFAPDSLFSITISRLPFENSRKVAESAFLRSLQINKKDACELTVTLAVPFNVDHSRAGKIYGLSFCPASSR